MATLAIVSRKAESPQELIMGTRGFGAPVGVAVTTGVAVGVAVAVGVGVTSWATIGVTIKRITKTPRTMLPINLIMFENPQC
ncbi:MAG: hypothetical protein GXP48_12395 [Acidobacteria bacterium]|nr:hypothetical protein [Acidobacteriota bacterium]